MTLLKTDFRQFIDEIQMIRRRKEFANTWKEYLLLVSGVGPNQEFKMTGVLHRNTIKEGFGAKHR